MSLTKQGREKLSRYIALIAQDAGMTFASVDAIGTFPVPVKTHEVLRDLVVDQDVTGFLARINQPLVAELQGKLIYGDMDQHVLKRSNPPTNAREASVAAEESERTYALLSTEADMLLSWEKLNAYARFPNFQETIRNQLARRIANDRLYVGWNGVAGNAFVPTAQILNLNKGWIQRMRDEKPANVISEIVPGSGRIFVGGQKVVLLNAAAAVNVGGGVVGLPATAHGFLSGAQIVVTGTTNYNGTYLVLASSGANQIDITHAYTAENLVAGAKATQEPDYRNLDELAVDLASVIPVYKRAGLTLFMPEDLRAAEKGLLYGLYGSEPSEKVVIERAFENLAGFPVETPAFLPARTLIATKHSNLSIYIHENWNRAVENKHELKGVMFWNEFSEGYFVEDPEAFVLAENIHRI